MGSCSSQTAIKSNDFGIIDVIRYLARGEKPVEDGHLFADLDGPRFQAVAQDSDEALEPNLC